MASRQELQAFIAARYTQGETAAQILADLHAPVRLGVELPAKELVRKIEMMRTVQFQVPGVPAGIPMWEIVLLCAAGDTPPATEMGAVAWYGARRLIRVRQDDLPIDFGKADIAAELGQLAALGFSQEQIAELTVTATEATSLARRFGFGWVELAHVTEALADAE